MLPGTTRKVDEDGNEYVFAERNVPSEPAMPILSALGHDVIADIEWPNYRSQRWGRARDLRAPRSLDLRAPRRRGRARYLRRRDER